MIDPSLCLGRIKEELHKTLQIEADTRHGAIHTSELFKASINGILDLIKYYESVYGPLKESNVKL